MDADNIIRFLKDYDGPQIRLMEVCGTHTTAIVRSGIRGVISPAIKLISGPGCPVCVTPAPYIDKCMEYSTAEGHALVSFGDMMKVPGTSGNLSEAKARDGRVELMYSPFEIIEKAERDRATTFVTAAVGFETTAVAYALLLKEAGERKIENIRLLTSLKTILPAMARICEEEEIDGFICPGHVSVITGAAGYEGLCAEFGKPFVIAGFEPEHILASIYDLVKMTAEGEPSVHNLYRGAVRDEGNAKAREAMAGCFSPGDAVWRGIGLIEGSGLYINERYRAFDAGSFGLGDGDCLPPGCRCGEVIVGRIDPDECPMFGRECTPGNPVGPCMASQEGACGIWR